MYPAKVILLNINCQFILSIAEEHTCTIKRYSAYSTIFLYIQQLLKQLFSFAHSHIRTFSH